MPKRFKYFVSAILAAVSFFMFISLPYESRYYGLLLGIVLVIFCYWFGLGIIFSESFYVRLMTVLLPVSFFVGFGLFAALLPFNYFGSFLLSLFFGIVAYILFLVENVFLVAIGYKTVPLYRAAYTVNLIILLLSSFFLFDTVYSFRMSFWLNTLLVFIVSVVIFAYQFWSVAIELPDDGKQLSLKSYILVPSLLMSQLALAFSFWPVGIFKGSIYLVTVIYILSGLIQANIRDRLFKKTWLTSIWIAVAVLLGTIIMTKWR